MDDEQMELELRFVTNAFKHGVTKDEMGDIWRLVTLGKLHLDIASFTRWICEILPKRDSRKYRGYDGKKDS